MTRKPHDVLCDYTICGAQMRGANSIDDGDGDVSAS